MPTREMEVSTAPASRSLPLLSHHCEAIEQPLQRVACQQRPTQCAQSVPRRFPRAAPRVHAKCGAGSRLARHVQMVVEHVPWWCPHR